MLERKRATVVEAGWRNEVNCAFESNVIKKQETGASLHQIQKKKRKAKLLFLSQIALLPGIAGSIAAGDASS